jgi:hypothetical protein
MAYYLMKSQKSNDVREKENGGGNNRSRLAINIITPHCPNNPPQHLAFSQQLHEEYELSCSAASTKREKKSEGGLGESRMKLRDYLFLAKTSATINAGEKKKVLSSWNENKRQVEPELQECRTSKAELRRNKYAIKNSEMFKILKEEMDKELLESLGEITTLKHRLDLQLMQHSVPSNGEMVMMYNLRSLIKNKLRKTIEEMKELVIGQSDTEEERVEVEIDISDAEFEPDFKLTADYCAIKCLESTKRLKHLATFGE